MIGMFVATTLAVSVPQCTVDKANYAEFAERMEIPSYDSYQKKRTLIVETYKIPGLGPGDISDTRVVIEDKKCKLLLEQEFESTQDIKLALVELSKTRFLVVSVFNAGGSGCGVDHMLIRYDGTPREWMPAALGHDNMGSLFVGDLGRGRGPGLVLLEAQWGSGSHYDPHPYRVWTYRWKDEHFIGPEVQTTKPMSPDPASVASALGLPNSKAFGFDC